MVKAMLLKNLTIVATVLFATALVAAGAAGFAPKASAGPGEPGPQAVPPTALDSPRPDGMMWLMQRATTASVMFARLGEVREDIDKIYKHLEALSANPADREAARQLRAKLLSAEDGLKAIRNNVDRIVLEVPPETKPTTSTPPPTAAPKSNDLEGRLRELERKLDELLSARSKAN
jgi:hypothetical protein